MQGVVGDRLYDAVAVVGDSACAAAGSMFAAGSNATDCDCVLARGEDWGDVTGDEDREDNSEDEFRPV